MQPDNFHRKVNILIIIIILIMQQGNDISYNLTNQSIQQTSHLGKFRRSNTAVCHYQVIIINTVRLI